MKYKDFWSFPGEFQGSEAEPGGITILQSLPTGAPEPVPDLSLDPMYESVRATYPYINDPAAEQWFEHILHNGKLPDHDPKEPEDFFDFDKFSYHNWIDHKKETERQQIEKDLIQQDRGGIPHVRNVLSRGSLANSDNICLTCGDMVIIRPEFPFKEFFFLGEVTDVIYDHIPPNNNNNNNNTNNNSNNSTNNNITTNTLLKPKEYNIRFYMPNPKISPPKYTKKNPAPTTATTIENFPDISYFKTLLGTPVENEKISQAIFFNHQK